MSGKEIEEHYRQGGGLLQKIESALALAGKNTERLDLKDIAAVDEFHTGGREATINLVASLDVKPAQHILDIGCGIGGTARYLAGQFSCEVTGVDLTAEFVETGNRLCEKTGLSGNIRLIQASALDTGLPAASFDGACMLHVGMNIEDKQALFEEAFRLLKPSAKIAVYDVMRCKDDGLDYPVPWAASEATSFPAKPAEYRSALELAGFTILHEIDRTEFALAFMERLKKHQESAGKKPAGPGLQLLMGDNAALKVKNMVGMMHRGILAPVEMLARKNS